MVGGQRPALGVNLSVSLLSAMKTFPKQTARKSAHTAYPFRRSLPPIGWLIVILFLAQACALRA
jgi:hypothetical protein